MSIKNLRLLEIENKSHFTDKDINNFSRLLKPENNFFFLFIFFLYKVKQQLTDL